MLWIFHLQSRCWLGLQSAQCSIWGGPASTLTHVAVDRTHVRAAWWSGTLVPCYTGLTTGLLTTWPPQWKLRERERKVEVSLFVKSHHFCWIVLVRSKSASPAYRKAKVPRHEVTGGHFRGYLPQSALWPPVIHDPPQYAKCTLFLPMEALGLSQSQWFL